MRFSRAAAVAALAVCAVFVTAAAALAYPSESATYPDGVARSECIDCHGLSEQDVLESSSESTPTASTRKGPHGAYTTGTNKCQTCHSVHNAPAGGTNMLPGATVKATCESCHDGTGGTGVYGVIKARTGLEPAATHSIESTSAIPGGSVDGTTSAGVFAGPDGTLTCNDCHSPHDSETVEPFLGDRLRSSVASDTAYSVRTNRLLRQSPGSSETTVGVYGTAWCASCHQGRVGQHSADSGLMSEHVVENDLLAPEGDAYYYDRLPVVTSVESTETTIGALGQSNAGYVMPQESLESTGRAEPQQGRGPICQQCHEDARNVGPSERGTSPTLLAGQEFSVTSYASEAVTTTPSIESTDNPRFQVFPHESDAAYFLVRPVEPAAEDTTTPEYGLCMNCHSLRHDVPEEYAECTACHDAGDVIDIHDASESGCYACHPRATGAETFSLLSTPELTLDCGTCHPAQLEPHGHNADYSLMTSRIDGDTYTCDPCHSNSDLVTLHGGRCASCHPGPRDSFGEWNLTCSQAGCHPTVHATFNHASGLGKLPPADDDHKPADGKDCWGCHNKVWGGGWDYANYNDCARCHIDDTTPPLTTSNAVASYIGGATIQLAAADVDVPYYSLVHGLRSTFYTLDGGPVRVGTTVSVPPPLSGTRVHTIQFWSLDRLGNSEARKSALFTVAADTTPPVTTSNAQTSYIGPATITLSATDLHSSVATTHYRLNGGAQQTGTTVNVPAPAVGGTATHTLEFWSVDSVGNVESPKTVTFTISSPTATLRLIWTGHDHPSFGSNNESVYYEVRNSTNGQLIASGRDAVPLWNGISTIFNIPVQAAPYNVYVYWNDRYDGGEIWGSVGVTVPGVTDWWY
jgi:hypothetical protein